MTSKEFEYVCIGDRLITSTPELLLEVGEDCNRWSSVARSVLGKQTATVVDIWGIGNFKRVRIDLDNAGCIYNHNDFIGFAQNDDIYIEDTDKSVLFFVE